MNRLHNDEIPVDAGLLRRLLEEQQPQWAHLPIRRVPAEGTDNWLLRLGTDKVARLPRQPSAVAAVAKEQRWLPALAPLLPVTVPMPLAAGVPGAGYPWPWSIYGWLDGEHPTVGDESLARDLAAFVLALQALPVPADPPRHYRGGPLAERNADTRDALAGCRGLVDVPAAAELWAEVVAQPSAPRRGAWFHGDLKPDNLLVRDGRLTAVIDFGGLAVGDPSVEQIVAWTLFDPGPRRVFRDALGVEDATWERGRGWALSVAVVALAYYRDTNPGITALSIRQIEQVLAG